MKNTFKYFLSLQDHFGITPNHLHKSKRQFHFLLSEITSMLINIGCISLFIMQLLDLINRSKPSINLVNLQTSIGPNITVSDDLIIAFGVLDQQYHNLIDPKLFEVHANYEVTSIHDGEFSNVVTPLEHIECNITNLPAYMESGYEHEFLSNSLDQYYCFKQTVNKDKIILGGNFGTSFYGIMSFRISRCKNNTNNTCYTNADIDSKIKLAWFEVFFLDHFIDVNNYANPLQSYSNSFYTAIEPKFTKSYWTYFNGITMHSDNGVLFETKNSFSAVKYEKNKFDVAENEGGLGDFIEFGVISSANEEIYYRSYLKIQDICAEIGGLLNGLNIVFGVVFGFIGQKLYNVELINGIFTFQRIRNSNVNTFINTCSAFISENMHQQVTAKRKTLMKVQLNSIEPIKFRRDMKGIEVSVKEIMCGVITCNRRNGCCVRKEEGIGVKERKKIFAVFKKKVEFASTILLQNELELIKKCVLREINTIKKNEESVLQNNNNNNKMKFVYYLDSGNSVYNSDVYTNHNKKESSFGLMEIACNDIQQLKTENNTSKNIKSVSDALGVQAYANIVNK